MRGRDDYELRKLLKQIDEAIPKYKKTLKFLEEQIPKADFPIEEELEEEAEKIKRAIANLELTKKIFTADLPQHALTAKVEKEIPKGVEKEKIKNLSVNAILTHTSTEEHIKEILKGQQKITSNVDKHHDESAKQSIKFLKIGLIGGGLIGFFASVLVGIIFQQNIPSIIFTNGTIIYP